MNKKILTNNNNDNLKYQIVINGSVLAERDSRHLAESFVSQLTTEQQNIANIVTITNDGKQVLFG